MVDHSATVSALECAFSRIGPICIKSKSEGHGVLWYGHSKLSKQFAVFSRKGFCNPLDAIKKGGTPVARFESFEEIALAGWKLD